MKSSMILAASLVLASVAWGQQSSSSTAAKPAATAAAAKPAAEGALPEIQTQKYKGTLLDASCASSATAGEKSASSKTPASGQTPECALSSSTKAFALRGKDGQVLRFDAVGNARAEEAIKNNKKWNVAASGGKTIQASVSGHVEGDRLLVLSID